jgi:hypothetical protein
MRTLSTTVSAAISKKVTQPVYLLRLQIGTEWKISTWDTDISWNGVNWTASGAKVSNLTAGGCTLTLPASDFWLGAILNNQPRNQAISIYEHHTDTTQSPQADAVLLFAGVMDRITISANIRITCLENSQAKGFPITSIDTPTFNYLLSSGDRITWGADTIIVN